MNNPNIKSFYAEKDTLLFTTPDGEICIQGINSRESSTSHSNPVPPMPFRIPLTLQPNETISVFHRCLHFAGIFTSLGRLLPFRIKTIRSAETDQPSAELTLRHMQFLNPIENVSDVVFLGKMAIFQKNGDDNHYLFNHGLIKQTAANPSDYQSKNVVYEPVLNNGILIYHRLKFPFEPTAVTHGKNFYHVHNGKEHMVLTQAKRKSHKLTSTWVKDDGILANATSYRICIQDRCPVFIIDRQVYVPGDNNQPLYSMCRNEGTDHFISTDTDSDNQRVLFYKYPYIYKVGDYPVARYAICTLNEVIPTREIAGADTFHLIVDIDCPNKFSINGDIICVNVRHYKWWKHMWGYVLLLNDQGDLCIPSRHKIDDQLDHFMLFEVVNEESGRPIYVYRVKTDGPVTKVETGESMFGFQTDSGRIYRFEFSSSMSCREMVLDPTGSLVHPGTIIYPELGSNPEIASTIKALFWPGSSDLADLEELAELGRRSIDDCLARISQDYLVEIDGVPHLSKQCQVGETCGRIFHLAIILRQSGLPFNIPLNAMAVLLKRNPTKTELEFFARLYRPAVFDPSLESNPAALDTMGHQSYRAYLESITGYDPNCFDCVRYDQLAWGFDCCASIPNVDCMTFPTLQAYLSGFPN